MLSDRGHVRSDNEDCAAFILPRPGDPDDKRPAMAVVADGMGGHAAGEVASRIACETMVRRALAGGAAPQVLLREAIAEANDAILDEAARHAELHGMGTTLTAMLLAGGHVYLGHVGDSRLYIQRGRNLHQLSQDHTFVAELARRGELSAEAARFHPDRNLLYQAVGTRSEFVPMVYPRGLPVKLGDRFLLCSDGLTDMVDDATIARELARLEPADACQSLVRLALDAGGHDNVTVGVFHVVDAGAQVPGHAPDTRILVEGRAV